MGLNQYVLAYDLGTTGTKATIFDEQGAMVASAFDGYNTYYPGVNQVEQDPEDWWRAVCVVSKQMLEKSKIDPAKICCLTFSGQMMGCVPVDREGNPLGNAIIWADQRGTKQAERLVSALDREYIYKKVGHRPSASYSAAKIMWIKDNQPDRFQRIDKVLQAKDFIVYRMTGNFYTDYSDASGTNLFNLNTLEWSDELIAAAGLSRKLLPDAVPSTTIVGKLRKKAAEVLGLIEGIPVVIGGGDGSCAAAGAGVITRDTAYHYLGSSSWIGLATEKPINDPAMKTFNWVHVVPGLYSPTGTMQAAGASYQWMRDVFSLAQQMGGGKNEKLTYQAMDAEAKMVPPGADRLLYLPYLMGERSPHWNPAAKGAFIGLTIKHKHSHMIRAVMEGVAFNLKIILEAFLEQGATIKEIKLIGGGAKGTVWRKILADIYNKPLLIPDKLDEATSMGAALTGGVGVGLYPDFSFIDRMFTVVDTVIPDQNCVEIYERLYPVFKEAYNRLVDIYDQLSREKISL